MNIQPFDLVDATFKPQHAGDLKPRAAQFVGYRGIFRVMWEIEDGDYVGQWAFMADSEHFGWMPECDLEIHKVITTPPVSWK